MKYREKLLDLIFNGGNDDAVMDWIQAQPLLEQPDILRELKELAEENAVANGEDLNELVEGLDTFDAKVDAYEDKILDEKLAEANLVMALEAQEKNMQKMDETVVGIREYVIECIVTNAPNAAQMRELIPHIIKYEKGAGIYDLENWKGIL